MKNKTFGLLIFLTFLCTGSIWAQEDIRITHGPYLQNMSDNEVTIVWLTNKNAVSWVELAPDDGTHFYLTERPKHFAAKNGVKSEGVVHTVKLTGLKPGTKYRYRVFSQEVTGRQDYHIFYGKVASSAVYRTAPLSFITNDHTKKDMTFTMINDIHGRSDMMKTLLEIAEPTKNDLVFFNGDMVSSMNNEQGLFDGFMDVGVETFAKEIPMYYCRGNHETRGPFATKFQDYFSPLNPELYFLVRQGPVCFVVLDCGEDKPDTDIEYSGITVYDEYRSREMNWLKEVLKQKEFTEAPFKVVICHMPPFGGWHGEQEVLEKFVPLLNDAKVDIMLCGHLHRHIKKEADEQVKFPVLANGNEAVIKGKITQDELILDIIGLTGQPVDRINIRK
ncbi:MAG: metallophosphoesterase [Tannerellaceae bacterium]|jgi:predicted phosphohydrolase|nr:metallophosphoesterase [Tannerellaceae bacterium]